MTKVVEGWSGRYYEDFEIGEIYRHALGKTVTEADNELFTMLTLNTQQSHFNVEYARRQLNIHSGANNWHIGPRRKPQRHRKPRLG
jgi:acyl dehydratase